MTVTLMPDVEYVFYEFLLVQAEITALVGSRIYKASLPKDPVGPLLKMVRIGGSQLIDVPAVLDESRIQVDCYGGSQREANRLAETLRSVVTERLQFYQHADGQILRAKPDPPLYLPDANWNTERGGPKPRYIVDVTLTSKILFS